MENTNVLVEILTTLRQLESSLEDQNHRLKTIEVSIHSTTSSPSLDCSHNFGCQTINKDLPDLPVSSHVASPSYIEDYRSIYGEVLKELFQRRFEFVDESGFDLRSDDATAPKEIHDEEVMYSSSHRISPHLYAPAPLRLSNSKRNSDVEIPSVDHADAYSMSVYSSRPLSRLSLNIPSVPPLPSAKSPTSISDIMEPSRLAPISNYVVVTENIRVQRVPDSIHGSKSARPSSPLWTESLRRSWSSRRTKSRNSSSNSLASSEKCSLRSHERAEMAYYAYDNFMTALRSAIYWGSSDRKSNREEASRLKTLSGCPLTRY